MAILAECPACHAKIATKHKACTQCGLNLKNLKKNGQIKYHVKSCLPGTNKRRTELVGMSLKEAREKDAERKTDNRRVATGFIDNIPQTDLIFGDLAEWFLGLHTTKRLKDSKAKKIHLDKFNARFGKTRIVRLRPSMLRNFQSELKDEGLSDRYVDYIIATARQAVRTAADDDLISSDCLRPFHRTKRLLKPRSNARDKVFTRDEYNALYGAASSHLKPIIAMGYYTGMREGEILNLKRDRLFLGERCIRLKQADTKERRKRYVPIVPALYEILKHMPPAVHAKHVFLYRGKQIKDIRYGFRTAVEKVGLTYGRDVENGYVFHDLRHTYVTMARKAGVPESVIMELTGHQTRSMFDRYNRVDVSDKVSGANRMAEFLETMVNDDADQGVVNS